MPSGELEAGSLDEKAILTRSRGGPGIVVT
jgi:hypothetical protein